MSGALASLILAAFLPGEVLTYEVHYLGLVAGEFTMEVAEGKEPGSFRLSSKGRTLNSADSLFHVRADSWCDVDSGRLLPVLCRSSFTSRRGVWRREVRYDRAARRMDEKLVENGEVEKASRDLGDETDLVHETLSGMYFVRRATLTPGTPMRFQGYRKDKRIVVEGVLRGSESLMTPAGPVEALVVDVKVKEKARPDGADGGTLWLSADERRIPLKVTFDAPLGTVEVVLVGASGIGAGVAVTKR